MLEDATIATPSPSQEPASAPRRRLKPADPCAMVLFGATGDLTRRLVVPALYNLARTKVLPDEFALIGVARKEMSTEAWRDRLLESLKGFVGAASSAFDPASFDAEAWKKLADRMTYVSGDLNDPLLYQKVAKVLEQMKRQRRTRGNAIFYLAVADQLFGPVVGQLAKAQLLDQAPDEDGAPSHWRRVVIEKPFGHSLESARALNACIKRKLDEDQIYRIDHFLGKDTVQSIMAFRFSNGLFEPIWNRDRIDHVQITAAETVGVETRGKFYEATGAMRDMTPNHLLNLLSMVAMEPPTGFSASAIRSKRADVLRAMPAVRPGCVVRGQYGAGQVLGKAAKPYRDEPDVADDSQVETFVAMELAIDNWRWAGVPFFIRTGKHLARRVTEIAVRFKEAPYAAFQDTTVDALRPNWLVLRIAPDEGISLQFDVKRPGQEMDLVPVKMDFHYRDWFPQLANVGYETLLYDVMIGDPTLYMRADMVEETWRVVQPALDAWNGDGRASGKVAPPAIYASGSLGPEEADGLLRRGGRAWRPLDDGKLGTSP